ncbi:MAG: CoA transferase [Acidimicrobiia bacterium]
MSGSLDDVTVVEAGAGLAGSIAAALLAAHGAQVFKLGPVADPVWDAHKIHLNTAEELDAWSRKCDVLIAGPDEVDADLDVGVVCTISAYGTNGPLTGRPAEDLLVAARTGLVADQPGWGDGPSFIAHPVPSMGAGLLGAQGVCAALLFRASRPERVHVETSLLAGVLAMGARVAGGSIPNARTWYWRANGPLPFYSSYECADGAWLQLGCIHDGFVRKAIAAFGLDDPILFERPLGPDAPVEHDPAHRQYELLAEAIRQRSRAEWLEVLESADVPCAPVHTAAELLVDPQFLHSSVGGRPDVALSVRVAEGRDSLSGGNFESQDSTSAPEGSIRHVASLPLRGLRVLDVGNLIAGPMSARLLSDLGAEVIKIERPEGGDIARQNGSPAFYALNSGKRGLAVDLQATEGRAVMQRLLSVSDVVVDNMRPGVGERLGFGWERLQADHPHVIYCHVSAFGSTGPYAHRPGLDPLAGALAGLQLEQGPGDGRPVYVQGAIVDHAAAMLAAFGTLVALLGRSRNGRGAKVETSLLDAAVLLNSRALYFAGSGRGDGLAPHRSQFGTGALRRIYQASDGWFAVAGQTVQAWEGVLDTLPPAVAEALRQFASASDWQSRDALLGRRLQAIFSQQSLDYWLKALEARGVPVEPVESGTGDWLLSEPHLEANGMVARQAHPAVGPIRIAYGFWRFGGTTGPPPTPAPILGEHSHEILDTLCYSTDDLEQVHGGVDVHGRS